MAYRWKIICVVVLSLVVGFQAGRPQAIAQEAEKAWVCRVISVQGLVLIKRHSGSRWQSAGLDDTLFAGDRIMVEANSRAGIVLRNDAVLRLDQNTTLVFTEIEQETTFIFELLKGAANFFSRRPRSLKILTPFVNGVVEGTEFYVQVDAEQTRIDLFEGRILAQNPHGELHLAKGQGTVASADSPPRRRLLVQPRNSVQWALYYPPVLVLGPEAVPVILQKSLQLFNRGKTLEAVSELAQVEERAHDTQFLAYRAALLLHLGRVFQARDDIQQALDLDPGNSEALALKAVIAVVQNRKEEALEAAQMAVQRDARSAAAQMALSHAHQAGFNLPGALKAVQNAVNQAAGNGTAWARLAELRLSTGELDLGVQAARRAAKLNPHAAHAHTMLGFAYLTQTKIEKAQTAFEKAIALDSAAPLPRLGLGLAKIRHGNLEQGRAEIEIAVGLDPVNSLMRSYLGKAYFDEKRGPLDEKQLEIAKALDPNDPTPWFYDAIRKQTLNRPGEALQDLQKSIALNDNRAVYRSRLQLDEDLAARSAGIGRIYSNLDFEEIALRKGWDSLVIDPSNHSAHRLLADMYAHRPRYEIARVSELLQSQLYQPLNLTPIQPQLSESNLIIPKVTGISHLSFNEFNPLFTRNRTAIQANVVAGEQNTRGDDLTLAGVYDWFSYSLGQYHYQTDGFRDNNDVTHDIYDLFLQARISDNASMQLEYRYMEKENGDLVQNFDPDDYYDNERENREERIPRIGLHYAPNANQHAVLSFIFNRTDWRISRQTTENTLFGPWIEDYRRDDDIEAYNVEGQYLLKYSDFNVVAGAGHYQQDQKIDGSLIIDFMGMTIPSLDRRDEEAIHTNAYVYTTISATPKLKTTLGVSADSFKKETLEMKQLNPKLGMRWQPLPQCTFRIGAYRTLKRSLVTNQTIEPTQVAGFNQFFDDFLATDAKRYGVGIDFQIGPNLFSGAEVILGHLTIPKRNLTTGTVRKEDQDEQSSQWYLYWLPTNWLAVSMDYRYEYYALKPHIPGSTPKELYTHYLPLGVSYFHPSGIYAKFKGQYIYQQVEEFMVNSWLTETYQDNFILFDASVGYRFPRRLGKLSLSATNLFDTDFNFYGGGFSTGTAEPPMVRPERQILLKAAFSF